MLNIRYNYYRQIIQLCLYRRVNIKMENARVLSKEELIENFGWEEYLVLSLMLLVSTLIGIYFAWKGQRSNAEYLLGGRRMGVFPVSMSLIAT